MLCVVDSRSVGNRSINTVNIHKTVAVMQQESLLFDASVRENVLIGTEVSNRCKSKSRGSIRQVRSLDGIDQGLALWCALPTGLERLPFS